MMLSVAVLAFVTLQRLGELVLARRNTARLLASGAMEVGAAHYPMIVAVHAAWILGLWWLAWDQPISLVGLAVFAVLQALRVWTGFRPCTPDGRPYIGALESRADTWVAAGHEGLGVTTALGTAQLLVEQVLGRAPAIDPAPYSPARALRAPLRQIMTRVLSLGSSA